MLKGRDYDHLFKLVIIGDSGVGKSSLLFRFADDTFEETYLTTIGVDFRFKTLSVDDLQIKLQIWDTAGQERFRTITSAYYKGADAIVVVYDATSQPTFDAVDKYWMREIESYADRNVKLLLLGNKSDLKETKQVDTAYAREFARKHNMDFYEVSAKTADSVLASFISVVKKLIVQKEKNGFGKRGKSLDKWPDTKLAQKKKQSSDQAPFDTCCSS